MLKKRVAILLVIIAALSLASVAYAGRPDKVLGPEWNSVLSRFNLTQKD